MCKIKDAILELLQKNKEGMFPSRLIKKLDLLPSEFFLHMYQLEKEGKVECLQMQITERGFNTERPFYRLIKTEGT